MNKRTVSVKSLPCPNKINVWDAVLSQKYSEDSRLQGQNAVSLCDSQCSADHDACIFKWQSVDKKLILDCLTLEDECTVILQHVWNQWPSHPKRLESSNSMCFERKMCNIHSLRRVETVINTFAASYLNTQGLNNSCLKSPASTKVDVGDFKHELLNQLRSTMAVKVLKSYLVFEARDRKSVV